MHRLQSYCYGNCSKWLIGRSWSWPGPWSAATMHPTEWGHATSRGAMQVTWWSRDTRPHPPGGPAHVPARSWAVGTACDGIASPLECVSHPTPSHWSLLWPGGGWEDERRKVHWEGGHVHNSSLHVSMHSLAVKHWPATALGSYTVTCKNHWHARTTGRLACEGYRPREDEGQWGNALTP